MKIIGYGSEGYYEQQVQLAILKENLLREATAARLAKGEIKPEDMAMYAEILGQAESSITYAVEKNEEHEAEEREKQRDREEAKDE